MMAPRALLLVLGVCVSSIHAESSAGANPIRKIVTLLQNMQKEIEAEGAKEKELFDKFMCFCSGNNAELTKQVADGKAAIDELGAKLKSEEAEKVQVGQELVDHQKDRSGAENDLSEGTVIRGKEQAEFEEMAADSKKNIDAMAGAIPALEKGMGAASFLQLPGADRLAKLVANYPSVDPVDRRNVLSFLEQSGDYVPQSGQIVGILKGMKDDMEANLKDATAEEEKATTGFGELKASKEKEIEVATEAIETKTARAGQLAVSVVQTADSLEDTQKEAAEAEKFVAQLSTECATKEGEWAERCKVRNEEITAISEAISILNDDDALDVFKKAVPSALLQDQVGFLQHSANLAPRLQKAQAILATTAGKFHSQELNVLLFTLNSKIKMTLKGRTQGFAGVIKMVDDMVALLGKDQKDDEKSKAVCEDGFDKAGDEQKVASDKKAQLTAAIEEATDAVATLADELASLEQQIKDLDKTVAEATEQRKEEHADFLGSQQLNQAAAALLDKAKNRMQKFYNPTLYRAPPKTEGSMEEKIIDAGSFVQVSAHSDEDSFASPPQAPETFSGGVQKNQKSAGVIGLMDMMIKELETDGKDAEYEEKTAQKDYQALMGDSEESRAQHTKSITDKAASKAQNEGKLQELKEANTATAEDLSLIATTIQDLHASCDFILQNFDLRREARTNEVESLKNAKAILSGASF